MPDFVELSGASGAAYRFRSWPEGDNHTPMAGNFAVLVFEGATPTIVALGVTGNLSHARHLAQAILEQSSGALFTRLNVSRSTRTEEHEDMLAARPAAAVIQDDG